MADRFTEVSTARARFVELYDQMMTKLSETEAGELAVEDWNEYVDKLEAAADNVWSLIGMGHEMPVIELCLPYGHPEHISPDDLIGQGE